MKKADCVVLGGGIVGLLTARELALHGMQVSLFDSGRLGQECSWAGGGILSPLYPWQVPDAVNKLAQWSQGNYPDLCHQLISETGIDPEFITSGMLLYDREHFSQARSWARINDYPASVLSPDEQEHLSPFISRSQHDVLYLESIAQIRNPALIGALDQNLRRLNIELYESTRVSGLEIKQNKVIGIKTTQGIFQSPKVVLACGAWSGQLVHDVPVYPVRGQMLCYKTIPGYLQQILLRSGDYIIPRQDGYMLVGSTMEDVGFNKGTTQSAYQHLNAVVESLLPGIKDMQFIAHWSGLRPATPSGIPYIGSHSTIEGLYLNTGHYRNGLLLAPGSARLVADCILDRPSFMGLDSFQIPESNLVQATELEKY